MDPVVGMAVLGGSKRPLVMPLIKKASSMLNSRKRHSRETVRKLLHQVCVKHAHLRCKEQVRGQALDKKLEARQKPFEQKDGRRLAVAQFKRQRA